MGSTGQGNIGRNARQTGTTGINQRDDANTLRNLFNEDHPFGEEIEENVPANNTVNGNSSNEMNAAARAITLAHLANFMPTFDGRDQTGESHWQEIKMTGETHGIKEEEILIPFLKRSLTGQAKVWNKGFTK